MPKVLGKMSYPIFFRMTFSNFPIFPPCVVFHFPSSLSSCCFVSLCDSNSQQSFLANRSSSSFFFIQLREGAM
ncbi:hypothetical protein ES288_A13G183200v1 [Gossypium darwinii]|uniref:Uncharacterized protein n=1 Tax=Gossypium darwinii TaxID=34276 RepID=A0A5D2E1M0_GOSDA|nr:hypothetical protein ES288_A13G183200v1 [Gossypium darwinii]